MSERKCYDELCLGPNITQVTFTYSGNTFLAWGGNHEQNRWRVSMVFRPQVGTVSLRTKCSLPGRLMVWFSPMWLRVSWRVNIYFDSWSMILIRYFVWSNAATQEKIPGSWKKKKCEEKVFCVCTKRFFIKLRLWETTFFSLDAYVSKDRTVKYSEFVEKLFQCRRNKWRLGKIAVASTWVVSCFVTAKPYIFWVWSFSSLEQLGIIFECFKEIVT